MRSTAARIVVFTLGLGVAAGCGQYSISNIRALKAFKDANQAYGKNDYPTAIELYQKAFEHNPDFPAITYFFLANSYENLYKPTHKGEPENDNYIKKAIENYKLAIQKIKDTDQDGPLIRKRSYEYLIAAYNDKLKNFEEAEPIAKQLIQMEPNEPTNYQVLGKLYEDAARFQDAEASFMKATEIRPSDPQVWSALGGYYNRQGEFDKTMAALGKRAEAEPNNPEAWHTIGTYYEDKIYGMGKAKQIKPAEQKAWALKGIEAEDKALQINPEFPEALIFKNILLRFQANVETDQTKIKALIAQADELQKKGIELQKKQGTATGDKKGKD
jgi:tetratricopeptide (TPR) repeat protein